MKVLVPWNNSTVLNPSSVIPEPPLTLGVQSYIGLCQGSETSVYENIFGEAIFIPFPLSQQKQNNLLSWPHKNTVYIIHT